MTLDFRLWCFFFPSLQKASRFPKVSGTTGSPHRNWCVGVDDFVGDLRRSGWHGDRQRMKTWKLFALQKGRREENIEITSNNKKSKQAAKQLTKYWFPNSLLHEKPDLFPLLFGFSEIWGNRTAVSPRMLKVAPQTTNRPQDSAPCQLGSHGNNTCENCETQVERPTGVHDKA